MEAGVVVPQAANSLAEKTEIPAADVVGQADRFSVARRILHPQVSVGVLGTADGAIQIRRNAATDEYRALDFHAFRNRLAVQKVEGVAGRRIEGRGVIALEVDVEHVDIKRRAARLPHRAELYSV